MSIRVTLDGQPVTPPHELLAPQAIEASVPQGKKIRVQLPPEAQAEPPPPKVLAFWYAEDRTPPPWRYTESPEERSTRDEGCC
jgi:hypothetical protein